MTESLQCLDKSGPANAQTVTFAKVPNVDEPKAHEMACDQMLLLHHGERAVGAAQYISMADVVICLIGAAALTGWARFVAVGMAVIGGLYGVINFFSQASAMLP